MKTPETAPLLPTPSPAFRWFPVALAALAASVAAFAAPGAPASPLLPVPASITLTSRRLRVGPAFTAAVRGPDDGRVRAALARLEQAWSERTGMNLNGATEANPPAREGNAQPTLLVQFTTLARPVPEPTEDESYRLAIDGGGAHLRAATSTGALRGLVTLTQLLQSDESGWYLSGGEIKDAPRFSWRGLLMDPARHWLPVDVIKRNLDGMALVKLNVLHFHLTDDQGFRVECQQFPRLHQLGSDGNYYTQEQIRDLVAYAAARGIRIVPEFDVPGHATSWAVSYPELASAPGPFALARTWGVHDVVLDPTNEHLYPLLDGFFGEMAALFPDEYVHVGGDENNGREWSANAHIQEFIRTHGLKDNAGLHAYFNRRLQSIVTRHGKKMIGWEEILHPQLPAGTVIHSWRGAEGLAAATRMGFATVLSRGYYLDHMDGTARYYANDPIPAGSPLTAGQQQRVMGGEACMWGEWATAETFDSRTWPNAAAVAERLWSPRDVTDTADLYRRLALVDHRLEEAGLLQHKNLEALWRRFVGDNLTPEARTKLRSFADLFESGALGLRARAQKGALQSTPLTGFPDCITGDSAVARQFADDVRAIVFGPGMRSPGGPAALTETLTGWRAVGERVASGELAPDSPRVRELAPLGRTVAEAATVGLAAVHDLAGGGSSVEVAQQRLKLLTRLGQPQLGVTVPVVAPLRLLVAAAALETSRMRLAPAEWSAAVERLAAPPAVRR